MPNDQISISDKIIEQMKNIGQPRVTTQETNVSEPKQQFDWSQIGLLLALILGSSLGKNKDNQEPSEATLAGRAMENYLAPVAEPSSINFPGLQGMGGIQGQSNPLAALFSSAPTTAQPGMGGQNLNLGGMTPQALLEMLFSMGNR